MRVFFVGCVNFSKVALKKLIDLNIEIVGVATKSKSNFNSDHFDLSSLCIKNDILFKYVKDINAPHIVDWIENLSPDIIFVFGWSSLIKESLIKIPSKGIIGFHPAKLPLNRGRHPIIWALVLGLEKTASTFFFMDDRADAGDILSQVEIDIDYEDDANTLYNKINDVAVSQIENFIPMLESNSFQVISQKGKETNYWRKRNKLDGQIDFRMSSRAIYNLVRALTRPYIGSHITYKDEDIKIWKVRERTFEAKNIEPGKILRVENNIILVKTYDGAIELIDHEFEVLPQINFYL